MGLWESQLSGKLIHLERTYSKDILILQMQPSLISGRVSKSEQELRCFTVFVNVTTASKLPCVKLLPVYFFNERRHRLHNFLLSQTVKERQSELFSCYHHWTPLLSSCVMHWIPHTTPTIHSNLFCSCSDIFFTFFSWLAVVLLQTHILLE